MPRKPALPFLRAEKVPPVPGYWLVYPRRGARHVPARIWWCDHEPGNPENLLDRWPVPFLAAEIGARWCEVWEVWDRVMLASENPQHWRAAVPLVGMEGLTAAEEYDHRMAMLDHGERNKS